MARCTQIPQAWKFGRIKEAPPKRALALSVQYLRVRIEPREQRGRYKVEVHVRDENSGKVLALEKRFGAKDR